MTMEEFYTTCTGKYRAAKKKTLAQLEYIQETFNDNFDDGLRHRFVIEERTKTANSILNKCRSKKISSKSWPDGIYKHVKDIAGIRCICYFQEDFNVLIPQILSIEGLTVVSYKDYIGIPELEIPDAEKLASGPKPNGYKGFHLNCEMSLWLGKKTQQVPIEIQIRTLTQNSWATYEGIFHYEKVKAGDNIDDVDKEALNELLNQLAKDSDGFEQTIHELKEISQNSGVEVALSILERYEQKTRRETESTILLLQEAFEGKSEQINDSLNRLSANVNTIEQTVQKLKELCTIKKILP